MAQHYLAYLTATDSRSHAADYLNLTNMVRYHPGVEKIVLFIAISRVSSERRDDPRAVACLLREVQKCPWLELRSVFWKSNIGRDFSSAAVCLNAMRDSAAAEDFVMVRNRSAYGPFEDSWYAKYVVQYERFANTGLVGSTINFLGHPLRPTPNPATHVQTYVYLSQWKHLEPFLTDYPGARCAERLDLIEQGEIGLSQSIMKRGLGLSCLQWSDTCFTAEQPRAPELPAEDIKSLVKGLPFTHRSNRYFWQPRSLLALCKWFLHRYCWSWLRPKPLPLLTQSMDEGQSAFLRFDHQ